MKAAKKASKKAVKSVVKSVKKPRATRVTRAKQLGAGYTATLRLLSKVYTAEGATVIEALERLTPDGVVRSKAIITMTSGFESRERVIPPATVMRLFSSSKMMREVALKNVSLMLS